MDHTLLFELARKDRKHLMHEAVKDWVDVFKALTPDEQQKALQYLIKGDADKESASAFKDAILPKLQSYEAPDTDVYDDEEDKDKDITSLDDVTKEPGAWSDENIAPSRKGSGFVEVNWRVLINVLYNSYNTKKPLMIFGDPGIGKSENVKSFAKNVASKVGKKFIHWDAASPKVREAAIKNPQLYFVFHILETAKIEPVDFNGIVDLAAEEAYIKYKKNDWAVYYAQPSADGILFFDEINRAARSDVMSAILNTILNKNVGGDVLSKDVAVMAAGNFLGTEGVLPLGDALTNRFGIVAYTVTFAEWAEWAAENGILEEIIAYVRTEPDKLFIQSAEGRQPDEPFATPRSIVSVSDRIKDIVKKTKNGVYEGQPVINAMEIAARMTCGDAWGRGFGIFLKTSRNLDFHQMGSESGKWLEKDPSSGKDKPENLLVRHAKILASAREVAKSISSFEPEKWTEADLDYLGKLAVILTRLQPEDSSILAMEIGNNIAKEMKLNPKKSPKYAAQIEAYEGNEDSRKRFVIAVGRAITGRMVAAGEAYIKEKNPKLHKKIGPDWDQLVEINKYLKQAEEDKK